jgi:hypothetical protein
MTTTDTTRLNELVRDLTAFRTLADLTASIEGGYVPTISNRSPRHAELALSLVAMGYRVYGLNGGDWK